jgi:hypothetical protein
MKKTLLLAALLTLNPGLSAGNSEPRAALIVAPSEKNARMMVALTHAARYAFLSPRDWSMAADEGTRTIRIYEPRTEALIAIHFDDASGRKSDSDSDRWKNQLESERKARVREAFTFGLLGSNAEVADLAWLQADSMPVQGRFMRIPVEKGWIEISLVAPAEFFESSLPAVMQLAGSLQTGPADVPLAIRSSAGSE